MSRFTYRLQRLKKKSHLRPPARDAASMAVRRARVRRIVCKRGRVCSGTPPCPCWDVNVMTMEEWEKKPIRSEVPVDLSPVLVMNGQHRLDAIRALARIDEL